MALIHLNAPIIAAQVYARGAVVSRAATLSDLPPGPCTVVVEGITRIAEAGSFRAHMEGRPVLKVQGSLILPQRPPESPEHQQKIKELEHQLQRLKDEENALNERLHVLGMTLQPKFQRKTEALQRVQTAFAAAALLEEVLEDTHTALIKVKRAIVEAEQKRYEAKAIHQQKTIAPQGTAIWRVEVELGEGSTQGNLTLHYRLRAARWWPSYTLRIAGGQGELSLDAQVAQASEEDWTGIQLQLSTGDLQTDLRLPTLPTLRFGRAQAPAKAGWRPPPTGLDRMFDGYQRVFGPVPQASPPPIRDQRAMLTEEEESFGAMDMPVEMLLAAPMPQSVARSAKQRMPAPKGTGFRGGMVGAAMDGLALGRAPGQAPEGGGGGGAVEELPIEPSDAWMDYDRLKLGSPDRIGQRGRLYADPGRDEGAARQAALQRIEALNGPGEDPAQSRGLFDVAYHAHAQADIPGDGGLHRVAVLKGVGAIQQQLRAVPRETPEVFRSALLLNPLDVPLLAGPLEVWWEGALLQRGQFPKVGRGGRIRVGLGLEERVKIARNVRIEEEKAGLLGGSLSVLHTITLEIASSLSNPVALELLERLPISDDKNLKIERIRATPEPMAYDQAESQHPIKGGLRWQLNLNATHKQIVELVYKLSFSARQEIVGGNRREN